MKRTGEYFHNLGGASEVSLGQAQNPEASSESPDRLENTRIKSFHMAADMINQTKTNLMDGRR